MNAISVEEQDSNGPVQSANPHSLGRQLGGLLFWVIAMTLPFAGVGTMVFALVLGGLTFTDAWVSGIYKDKDRKAFLNISPMAWGIVMVMLLLVAYPAYVLNRNKLRTIEATNGYYYGVIALGGLVFAMLLLRIAAGLGLLGTVAPA